MLQVPTPVAVTKPVEELTVATNSSLLLHAPVPLPNTTPLAVQVVVAPTHNGLVPPVTEDISEMAITVIDCCAEGMPLHPPGIEYIILQVPAPTAVTKPVDELTVATNGSLLLHTPPGSPLLL